MSAKAKEAHSGDLMAVATLAPVIEVRGEITSSNFPELKEMIREGLAQLNLSPSTDEEFGQAEQDTKALKAVEQALVKAKAEAIARMEAVQTLFDDIDETGAELRQARLDLEKAVKAKKEEIRTEIVDAAWETLPGGHQSRENRGVLLDAMKGKRTIETLQKAAEDAAAEIRTKVEANSKTIEQAVAKSGEAVAPDRTRLEAMNADALAVELQRRAEKLEAEAERKRLEAEAEAERQKARKAAEEAEAKRKAEEPEETPKPTPSCRRCGQGLAEDGVCENLDCHPPVAEDAEVEFDEFLNRARSAFAALKEAKEELKDPENIKRVGEFSRAVNEAWGKLTKGGDDE